ncbi:MAG: UDP-N-acetylmuramate dehydrogenase [Betaproteobacteria bacterium]
MAAAIEAGVSLRALTTFGVEARAAYFASVRDVQALRDVLADPRVAGLPRLILGGGSNILFTRDFDGLVIRVDIPGHERIGEDGGRWLVRVGAGESWHGTVARLLDDALPGLENLALIPGSVGAAPIQNIGAYGLELAERLRDVEVFDLASGALASLDVAACRFGYRDSVFKREGAGTRVVVGVTLALPRQWTAVAGYADLENELKARGIVHPAARDVFDAVVAIRRRKLPDPQQVGNAGSFFKNPVVPRAQRDELIDRFPSLVSYDIGGGRFKLAAGWLIEACGLKGAVRGRAGVYPRQALVLVNLGGATGAEILALAREVQDAVRTRFGVELEPEPTVV